MPEAASLTLKDEALRRVKEFLSKENVEGSMLRISLVRTHCMGGRGYTYGLAPELTPSDADMVEEVEGLTVLFKREDLYRLQGTVIDYVEGLQGSGFVVENPNAVGKCHCGRHDFFE